MAKQISKLESEEEVKQERPEFPVDEDGNPIAPPEKSAKRKNLNNMHKKNEALQTCFVLFAFFFNMIRQAFYLKGYAKGQNICSGQSLWYYVIHNVYYQW